MTELEIAAARWKTICEDAPLDRHPSLLVAHFLDDTELGSIYGTAVSNEANLVMILGSPFAVSSDVTDCFVFLDRGAELLVSHLAFTGRGVVTTDYRLPYSMGDTGSITFEMAEKAWAPQPIRAACDHLSQHRLSGAKLYDFLPAFITAKKWGELHESA